MLTLALTKGEIGMDKKRQILITARALFNEKGYHQVKMRDISNELGISVGNLTYHYKKKQDIIQAIHQEVYENLSEIHEVETLSDLMNLLRSMIRTIFDEKYYFNDRTIGDELPDFIEEQGHRSVNVKGNVINGMKKLRENGLLEIEDESIEVVIQFILLSHIGWILDIKELTQELEDAYINQHLILLKTYLTEEGFKEYENIKKR